MQFLGYLLVYPLLWLFSLLPFRILYLIADGLFYLLYYVFGYRKQVVFDNLKLVFREKAEQERTAIAKKFYRHFIDIFGVEMIKSFSISKKEIKRRYKIQNIEVIHQLEAAGKSCILLGAHYANWEWVLSLNDYIKINGYGIYKKLKNPYLDKKICETRSRFNTTLVPTKEIFSLVDHNQKNHIQSLYGFLSDQSPRVQKAYYWDHFLGVKVPVYTGVEVLAKKYDLPIVFFKTKKIKRGFYETTLSLLTDKPGSFKDYDLSSAYLREVEKMVYEAPEYYLWTHKRFKHKDSIPKGT
ncbi:MAG: lipid A biosynthesis acyltransferase [Flavobacteriaceae bacterium]|nr:lipid A biosynthesis acyltransferase [Flavobacteriaceae bacterium]